MDESDIEQFRMLEESLLSQKVRSTPHRLAALLADDFVEFGVSGRVFGKQDVIDAAASLPDVETPLLDFSANVLSTSVVLVTYRSTTRLSSGEKQDARRSSIWVQTDGNWQLVFHQGTRSSAFRDDRDT